MPYDYSVTGKNAKGNKVRYTYQASLGSISGHYFADNVKICTVRRYKSWAELYAGVGSGEALSCDAGYVPCSKDAAQTICVAPEN